MTKWLNSNQWHEFSMYNLVLSMYFLRSIQHRHVKQFLMLNFAKARYSAGGNGCPANIKTRFWHLKYRYRIYVALKVYVRCSNLEAEINVVSHARKESGARTQQYINTRRRVQKSKAPHCEIIWHFLLTPKYINSIPQPGQDLECQRFKINKKKEE